VRRRRAIGPLASRMSVISYGNGGADFLRVSARFRVSGLTAAVLTKEAPS